MKAFRYGDLEILVKPLEKRRESQLLFQQYGIKIVNPVSSPFAFKIWHLVNLEDKLVAQLVVYDLIEAFEDPLGFLQRHNDPEYLPLGMRSVEASREFIRVANLLKDFLKEAHRAVLKQMNSRGIIHSDVLDIHRGPREWFPGRKP